MRARRKSCAVISSISDTARTIVPIALTSGVMPLRIEEKIYIGRVVFAPATKNEIMKSSKLKVKLSRSGKKEHSLMRRGASASLKKFPRQWYFWPRTRPALLPATRSTLTMAGTRKGRIYSSGVSISGRENEQDR